MDKVSNKLMNVVCGNYNNKEVERVVNAGMTRASVIQQIESVPHHTLK